MIPIEYLWLLLIGFWAFIGSARGLAKELGTSSVVMISLFTLFVGWDRVFSRFAKASATDPSRAVTVEVAYFALAILFVAYISYQGVVLSYPVRQTKGLLGGFLGFFGGLANGYLIIGTIWDVLAQARYFQPKVDLVALPLTKLHGEIAQWLPLMLMDRFSPFVLLVPGVFLLLLIILK